MENIFEEIRRYNLWDGENLNTGFIRTYYLELISGLTGNKLIKVLVGQRRSGKSYVLRQLINLLITQKKVRPGNIFYVNKEYSAFDDIKSSSDLEALFKFYIDTIKPSGKIYIFLDEVQNIEKWESFVNSYSQDFTREYELFLTGSNSRLLSGELATLLSGRYVEFEIFPFSYFETADLSKQKPSRESFINYITTGGLPELVNISNDESQRYYVESLKNTIILRDIVERHNIKDPTLLEDIFKFMVVNIGNLTSINSIIKYFKSRQKKTNYETLSSYAEYITDTFIMHKAERFNLRGKQILGGECKYYLNDLAFKNYLFGFSPADMGYNLENYVFNQLRRLGYIVNVGVMNNFEIDFVAKKPEKTLYVQVSYLLSSPEVVEREFGNLLRIKDNHEKIVVSLDEVKFSDYQGIKHVHPWELT
ncbi:MAG TPA: ATP-binding protein [Bacteroidales bacterium]|jgi:predicted AAA+ superfamily ATPase|nr:ATP-binding protein [Bacteroidales bacterium]HPM87232.1 ATP-binding protein [Bacteroidales bacterium]